MSKKLDITRHEHVFDPSKFAYPIHIIGAGATGSRVFAALLELGMGNIHIYDDDVVEAHNLANQIYVSQDIGISKVEGCLRFAQRKLGLNSPDIEIYSDRITGFKIREESFINNGIVFLLTDTMGSRKNIFTALTSLCDKQINNNGASDAPILVIETRMGATHGSVFTINPFDIKHRKDWLSTLVDDEDEDNLELSPCGTTLSVGTTASLIANYAVWQMMQFFIDPIGLKPRVDLFFKPTLTITSDSIAA